MVTVIKSGAVVVKMAEVTIVGIKMAEVNMAEIKKNDRGLYNRSKHKGKHKVFSLNA